MESAENNRGDALGRLEDAVTQEYAQKQYANVVTLLRQDGAAGMSEAFRDSLFFSAIGDNAFDVIHCLIEDTGLPLTVTSAVMAVNWAACKRHTDLALYLSEKAIKLGAAASDAWQRIFHYELFQHHDALVDKILETTALDRQAALDQMMKAAMESKLNPVMRTLLDKGAKASDAVFLHLIEDPAPAFYKDANAYSQLLHEFLKAGIDQSAGLDLAFSQAAQLLCAGKQRSATLMALLNAGADPCANASEVKRLVLAHYEATKEKEPCDIWEWEIIFNAYRESEKKQAGELFDTHFGKDFRVADLVREVDAVRKETGLMIAARAGMLAEVMDKAVAEQSKVLAPEHLVQANARGQSLLTLAVDRGTGESLLGSCYWEGREKDLFALAKNHLSPDQLETISLQKLRAGHTRHSLVQNRTQSRWKL